MTLKVYCGNCPKTRVVRERRPWGRYSRIHSEPCDEHPCPMVEVDPAELAEMKIRFAEEP
jgi:hypothetical protein